MRQHLMAWLAAAGLIAAAASGWAQEPANQTAQQNVQASRQYESLLCTNPGFRAKRIAQECGPLEGSQFYNKCVGSFQCGAAPKYSNRAPPSETIK